MKQTKSDPWTNLAQVTGQDGEEKDFASCSDFTFSNFT